MAARAEELTTTDAADSPRLDSPEAVKLWLSERFAQETDPTAILRTVAATLGRFLGVSRVGYGEIAPGEDWITIPLDWTDGIATMVGRRPLMRHTWLVQEYMRGRTLVVPDTEALGLEDDQRAALRATDTRAFVAVPLIHGGEFVALFACNHHAPRAWTPAEVELIQQTGARVWSALQHARTIARLRESEEQFRQLAENIPALCWLAGPDGVPTWGNRAWFDYFGAEDVAQVATPDVVHPDDLEQANTLWADAIRHGTPVETVVRLRSAGGEYRPFLSRATPIRDAAGAVTRWTAVMVDLTEQRRRDEHRRFFDALADAIREETDSARILARVGDMLKAYLGASRVMYSEVDPGDALTFVVHREAADPALPAATGRYRFGAKFAPLYARLTAGETIAWSSLDGAGAPPAAVRDLFRQTRMPAAINVPLVKDGRLVAMLSAHAPTTRAWTAAEIALVEDVAERTWSTVTRARAEAALKQREATQAFLVAWTDRLRGERDPAALLDATLAQLGRHLGVNRAVYSEIELDGGHYTIVSEWCRGVAPVRGLSYPASNLSPFVRAAYLAGETVASDDLTRDARYSAVARAKFAEVAVVGRIGVPLTRDGRTQAILAVDTDHPRRWTAEERQLVRDVAERVWTLLQQARAEAALQRREREQALLLAWSDRVRGETQPDAVIAATLALVGEHLGATRVSYMEADAAEPRLFTVLNSWCDGVPPIAGRAFSLDWIGEAVNRRFLAGEAVQSADVSVDADVSQPARELYAATDIVAVLSVPLVRDGAVRAVLSASHNRPRAWVADDRQLLRELADRMWAMLERARAERALRERERHQAFLLDWVDRLRGEADPARLVATTLERLADYLAVSRANFAEIGADGGFAIVQEVGGDDRPIAAARDGVSSGVHAAYLAGATVACEDVASDARFDDDARTAYRAVDAAAFVGVPMVRRGRVHGVLSVQDANPRHWGAAAVQLLRDVADRLLVTMERARAENEIKARERDQALLIEWSDTVRGEHEAGAIVATTLALLGRHLGLSRTTYAEPDGEQFTVTEEWRNGVASVRGGGFALASAGQAVEAAWRAGATVRYDDVGTDPRLEPAAVARYRAREIAAFVSVPMVRDGALCSALSVQSATARTWRASEIELIRELAERTWAALARARTEAALAARERDQAFLLAWSDRLRQLTSPERILQETLDRLMAHIGADRATYAESDADGDLYTILGAAGSGGVATIGETYRLSEASAEVGRIWRAGGAIRYDDVLDHPRVTAERAAFYTRLDTRAFVSVPLFIDGVAGGTLSVQSAAPRMWHDSDEQLVREVAERLWTTLERARATAALAARERDQAFLLGWSDRLRQLIRPDAILAETLALLNAHLGATRSVWAESDASGAEMAVLAASDGLVADERYKLADVPATVRATWLAGGAIRYDDLATDDRVPPERVAYYASFGIRSFLSVPLTIDGVVRATLSVRCATTRAWDDDEEQLIRDVAERLWIALERARATAALGERERDQAFLLDWGDRLRAAHEPAAILATTLAAVGEYLGATRATYSQADASGRVFAVLDDWCRDSFSIAGTSFSLDDVGATVEREWLTGEVVRYDDVAADPRLEAERVPSYLDAEIAAFVSVPLVEGERVRCALSVQSKTPRQWREHEIALLRAVAERTWIILERARVQDELAERQRVQTFLIGWSDRVRSEASPHAILALTLDTLGRQLGATRANYAECDAAVKQLTVVDVWGAETATRGTVFPFAALGEAVVADSLAGRTLVVEDVAADPRFADVLELYRGVAVAAVVTVPLVRAGRLIAVLSVQQDTARVWTAHEVRLIEEVADRTWSVLERAHSEARLAESEAQLSAFMDNAPIAMYLKDGDGRYTRMNREMGLVLGAEVEEALGRTTHDFMPPAVAADVARLDALALAGGVHAGEIHIDGRERYLDALSLRFPVPRHEGAIDRLGGFVLDLTERKRAEAALEQSREALFQTEKLSALGSLLAGVSHELNNPLSIVVAQAVMMERQAKDTPLAERAFKIRKAADRCARIVQTFLAMARQKRPERAPVDLNSVVAAALELAEYGLRSDGITVTRRLDPALPRIAADADQLHQIIVNLIVNAQHALAGHDGERAVTIATAAGPEPQTVVLDVADTGPGIPEEVARRIFEPFFTTKPQGEGTGVGLSFSQGLAEAHGGRLSLLPSERGACFRLTLPRDADGVLTAAAPETIAALAPRSRRALVIDDEAEIAEALADFLELEGYRTEIAVGGVAGKAKLVGGDYDLVVSDLRMPELDGPELYRWLRETRPRLAERVAFTTGDTLGSAVARFLAEAKRPVLEKPFVPEAVRRFLDQLEQP